MLIAVTFYIKTTINFIDYVNIISKFVKGYGVAGDAAGNCNVWNYGNKQARINDGVVALSAGIGARNSPPPSLDRINLP